MSRSVIIAHFACAFVAATLTVSCGGGGGGGTDAGTCMPSCSDGFACQDGSCVNPNPCQPACQGKQCGDDGCGGSCGACPAGKDCNPLGVCVEKCVPDCAGKNCGDNGCGGSCGDCAQGETCNAFGACEAFCRGDCTGKECGDDGCGASCGVCGLGEKCEGGKCVACQSDCTGKDCGDDGCGGTCGDCKPGEKCESGLCVLCVQDCAGKECGDDGCGGVCGKCPDDKTCGVDGKCVDVCHPDCVGKECGDDGCGGSCAECVQGYYCSDKFECVQGCQPQCAGKECGDDGCGDVCGECGTGKTCDAGGLCVGCQSDCANKECGDDGCGGTCGECGTGKACDVDGKCVVWEPCKVESAIKCGDSVYGDTTGKGAFLNDYDCSTYDESGPEAVYSFTDTLLQSVTISFDGDPDVDLDLFVLGDSCELDSCLDYGDSSVTFEASPSTTYLLVVDGYEGAKGEFFLDVACCVKDCAGKACDADDGCGGECGCAGPGQACVEGQCLDPTCAGFCDDYYVPFDCSCSASCFDNGNCCADICDTCSDVFVDECCVPDCAGKQCGQDGCGGSCGECLAGTKCDGSQCAPCQPDCAGKVCGDDQCNGSCGECGADQACDAQGQCLTLAACTEIGKLVCGQPVSGDTTGLKDFLSSYSCSTWSETGPEAAYSFTGDVDQQVTISFATTPAQDLDLFVVDGTCDPDACLESGNDSLVLDAVGGETYFVIVDGFEGVASAFDLTVDCCVVDCNGKTCDQDNGCGQECGCADQDKMCVDGACMTETCTGSCGDQSPFGCYCDIYCFDYGDCCADVCEACKTDFPDYCCTPDCQGKVCGDDGCGGSCGSCLAGTKCAASGASCEPCTPVCDGKDCGDDQCNGSCGECAQGFACVEGGKCIESNCPSNELEDCNGVCRDAYYQGWIGDGYCDDMWNCEKVGFDGGDCP